MANANTEISLDQLFQVIVDQVQAQFPDLVVVEFDRDEGSTPPQAPACILEMTEGEKYEDQDPGTGQLAFSARFEARLLVGFNRPRAKAEARKRALAFAAWMHLRRWGAFGCPSGPAEIIGAYRDDFHPALDKFEAWKVEWVQVIHLGTDVWKDDPTAVTPQVFVRLDPAADPATYTQPIVNDGQHHPVDEYVPLADFLNGGAA